MLPLCFALDFYGFSFIVIYTLETDAGVIQW